MPSKLRRASHQPSACAASGLLCLAMVACLRDASGQPAEPKVQTWSQVDQSNDMKQFRDNLRLEESLGRESLAFLMQTLLPQLEAPVNREQIDRVVRRRLRDLQNVFEVGRNPAVFEQFTKALADFMVQVARDGKKDSIVRVNAVLLVGELNDASKSRPWEGSLEPLAAIVADQAVSPEVRIAAAAGLQRHADAARQAGPQAEAGFVEKAAAAIMALLAPPAGLDPDAAAWMETDGLAMLRSLGAAAPAGGVATAARIFKDRSRTADLRIRAGAVIGASKAKDIDPAQVVAEVESLAVSLLQAETRAIEEQRSAADASEKKDEPVRRQAHARLAWRLATLGDAVFSDDTTGGVATLMPEPTAAKDLARKLRQAASDVAATANAEAVGRALERLAAAKPAPEPEPKPEPKPVQPTPQPEPDPNDPFK